MEVSVSALRIYDSYFEELRKKILNRLEIRVNKKRSKYNTDKAKFDLCISLISKIYGINQNVLKDRSIAHSQGAINENYREACGMLYFILMNDFKWTWNDIATCLKTNNFCIHTYVNKFQESKNRETKEKYLYIVTKVNEAI